METQYTTMWRLIEYSAGDAGFNMAADEAVALMVESGDSPPTLRFYGWTVPSVTIGAFQRIANINTAVCQTLNISVVRRPTGGRAIVHDDELTFSFSTGTRAAPFSESLLYNYTTIGTAFFQAFQRLGLDCAITQRRLKRQEASPATANPMCFSAASYSEITIDGRKILGAAQKRYRGALLEQGAIPLSVNRPLLSQVFGSGTTDNDTVAGLREFDASITLSSVQTAVVEAFEKVFNIRLHPGQLAEQEMSLAQELLKKYQSPQWTFRK
ncbi:lipoate--protein ligase family protein [Candidatus Magnetominusculus dajiuhuensis]|uniref:lipoate--protein ligase family protein n=1 Tax=Candidatus Magnetominusculus dajiuhuensis TaxID=3137712 RepID=UPI003B42BFC6